MCSELLVCGARGRIRTADLPITSRTETFQLDPPRTILAAQEQDRFHPDPSCGAWYQGLGAREVARLRALAAASLLWFGTLSIRSQSEGRSPGPRPRARALAARRTARIS
jgi:hypothetical protein